MNHHYRIALCCLLALLLLPPVLFAGEGGEEPVALAPAEIRATAVIREEISSRIEVVGTVRAVEQAAIAAKIAGVIVEIPVALGTRVNKGDLLIKINAEEISARVLQAQAQLAQARRNLERERKLLKQQASTPETVRSMQDMVAVAEAGYREASSMLAYTTITAPFSGVITRKIANTGDLATPGTPLLHLEDDSRLQVVAPVPESLSLRLREGETLSIRVPAAELDLQGTVAEISPVIDPASRTAEIKINLDRSRDLRTGMFARVRLPGGEAAAILVPTSAIVPFGQLEKVFVIENDTARLRLVRSGRTTDGFTEILSGLNPGEQVAVSGNRLLVNGQPVRIN